jgi:hypothetical protein
MNRDKIINYKRFKCNNNKSIHSKTILKVEVDFFFFFFIDEATTTIVTMEVDLLYSAQLNYIMLLFS